VTTFLARDTETGEQLEMAVPDCGLDTGFELFARVVANQMIDTGHAWTMTSFTRPEL
jgi:hypothetical protein